MTFSPGLRVPTLAPAGSVRRSVQLFGALRAEETDPEYFRTLIARDAVQEMQRWGTVRGQRVLHVGAGTRYFAEAFREAGASYLSVDPAGGAWDFDAPASIDVVKAPGIDLPFETGSIDICFSSNVLERVAQPERMADELLRVTRSGGLVVISWTPWRAPFPCSVARMIRWLKVVQASRRLGVVQVLPRYHPKWARWVVGVPGVREIASGDAVIVVRRR